MSPSYKSTLLRLDSAGNIISAKTYGYSATTSESNFVINGINNSILSAGIIHEPGLGSNVTSLKLMLQEIQDVLKIHIHRL